MSVKKCPKCGAVWSSALLKCAFCGIEGEDQPISTHTGRLPEPPAPAVQPKVEKEPAAVTIVEAPPPPPTSADVGEAPPAAEPDPIPAPAPIPTPVLEAKTAVEQRHEPSPDFPGTKLTPLPSDQRRPDPSTLPPAPQVPSAKLPLVLGLLGVVACAVLPVAAFVKLERIVTIMAYLVGAILLPLAPLSWYAGRRYEDRCIDLGFRPSTLGRVGRLLGMTVTILISLEGSVLAFLAAVRLISARN